MTEQRAKLGALETGIVNEVHRALANADGSRLPLGRAMVAMWPLLPIVRASLSIREDWREPSAGRCDAFQNFAVVSEDDEVDVLAGGERVLADDDRVLAEVLNGGPARIHRLEPARKFDRRLYAQGIRWTSIFPLHAPNGHRFGTFNCGSRRIVGIDEPHRPVLGAIAQVVGEAAWRALSRS